MLKKLTAVLVLAAIPLFLFANIYHVPTEIPTVEEAVMIAVDGDTILVPASTNISEIDLMGKDLVIGFDDLEPEDAEPDSSIYGPQEPFPPTPVE